MASQFPIQTELAHGAEFIMSEANGQLSRDVVTIAATVAVQVGQTLKITTPATLTAPAVVAVNVTTDTACDAIAIYAATAPAAATLNIAVIARNAEVNSKLLYYPGTLNGTDKLNIAKALLLHNIIVRD